MTFLFPKCLWVLLLSTLSGLNTAPITLTLTTDVNDVFVNSSITLTCLTSSTPFGVTWFKTEKGSESMFMVISQMWVKENNSCQTTNNDMECSCSSSQIYSCSIQPVNLSNDGQRWLCKAFISNVNIGSNIYTIRLILPLTSLTIIPQTPVAYPVFNVVSNFTCITSFSRPAARIQWFNDNINITNHALYSTNDDVARSVLLYTSNVNGYSVGNISCIASYEYKSISKILTANMRIKIQFPVSKPIVTINNLHILTFLIREDRLVHLNCSSSGYPPASYQWIYPAGKSTGALLDIQFKRNNGSLSCMAHNVMRTLDGINTAQATEEISALNINVLYPSVVTNLSNKDNNVEIIDSTIRVERGDIVNIVCTSDANPPATVFWQGQLNVSPTLTIMGVQHDALWTCQTTNYMTEFDGVTSTSTFTRNISARVLYGPGVPTITYTILPNSTTRWSVSNDSIRVIEGSTIILMCSVNSVPNSTYTWDAGHEGRILTIVNVTRTTNPIYQCTVSNVMETSLFKGIVIGRNYSFANLDILYGPATIQVKYNNVTPIENEFKVIKGWSFTIVCSASSNPASRYSWFGPVTGEGEVLSIRNVRSDMNRNVTCKADSTMVDSVGKSVVGNANVTVLMEVLYSPDVQRLQNQTVLLNTSLTVVCNLTDVGNPPASNFSWIRKDNNQVVGTGKTLTISNIILTDEGEYQCYASNSMQPIATEVVYGLSQSTVYINVEYGAYVQAFEANQSHKSIVVNQGETVELLCDAYGDPEPVVRVMNTTRGKESILVEIKGRKAKYHIQQAKCEYDTGNYTCSADNRYNEGRQLLVLTVFCIPRASPFSPPIKTLYRAPYDTVLFTFTIIAYPKPTSQDVVWYKRDDGSWRVLSDDANYLVTISDDYMQTQLKIFHVKLADYIDYMVNVSNKLGSTVEVFTLKAQSKPDVPKELQVSRIGKTEMTIEWIPGFNGGESQTFTIRYKALGEISWIVIPFNTSQNKWTLDGCKSGTTYQIQMMAQNKIGKSNWTQEIHVTTLLGTVGSGLSTSALGGSVGGVFGVLVVIAVSVLIWRYRSNVNALLHTGLNTSKQCPATRNSVGQYEDLVREQCNNAVSTTYGSYETCRIDSSNSRHTNQYETLEELECRQYLRISACISQQVNTSSAEISASGQTDVSAKDPEYVNLQLFTQ